MKTVRLVAAVLLAIPLLVFGGNYFLHFLPAPPSDGSAGDKLLHAMTEGGLMMAVAASHIVAGTMLVVPRTRYLGALLQLPMTIGIVAFHVTMAPAGDVFSSALLLFNLAVLADPRRLRALVE